MPQEYLVYGSLASLLVGIAFLVIVIGFIIILTPRKSKTYRKTLMDLYVASKIRFLAKKDNLDLDKEYISYQIWSKKQRMEMKDLELDSVIEEEIKEKISEPIHK